MVCNDGTTDIIAGDLHFIPELVGDPLYKALPKAQPLTGSDNSDFNKVL